MLFASWLLVVPLVVAAVRSSEPERQPAKRPDARATALPACTIIGSDASETLVGTEGDDIICALGGDDVVRGRGGDDVLFGSFGNDVLEGGPGDDHLKGHWGRDVLRGGSGSDRLHGGGDPDVFSGGAGSDLVDYSTRLGPVEVSIGGGAGDGSPGEGDEVRGDVERARGGAGDDRLVGNAKANRLYGGGGDDTLIGRKGNDRMWGGAGVDRVDGRDAGRFKDRLKCGAGRPDVALANATDIVAADCENGRHGAPPTPEAPAGPNRPPTDITLSNAGVAENRPVGTVVGTLDATDRDAGDTHRFALINGNGADDNAAFSIDGDRLKTAAVFDFESKSSYSIRVRARDERGAAFQKALTIAITDVAEFVNHAPTDVSLAPALVAENLPTGSAVGTLAAIDSDPGDPHAFALVAGGGDADNGAFTVAGDQLRTAQSFDFESRSSYSIRVATTDAAGATFAKALTVTIADANEAPAALALSNATLPENEPTGTTVGALSVTDVDAGQTHAFTLVPGAGDADNGKFAITGSTLKTAQPLDFETSPTYSIRVRATDDGTPAMNVEHDFTITVTDTLEPPTAANKSAATDEGAPVVVTLSATDPEGDDVTAFNTSAPTHGVVGSVGAITCAGTPKVCSATVTFTPDGDYNGPAGFSYTASDGARDSLPATVSITVRPVNDSPTASPGSRATDEDTPVALNLADFVDDVETDAADLSYEIVTPPAHGGLTGSGQSRTYTPVGNYNGPDSFTYKVTDRGDPDNCGSPGPACDAPETSTTETVSIAVNPVNDPPTADAKTITGIAEEASQSIVLGGSDTDGEPLTFAVVSTPQHGSLDTTAPTAACAGTPSACTATVVYTPAPNFNGSDSFTYRVDDGTIGSALATVSITVDPVNDTPQALPANVTTEEDAAEDVDLGLLVSDVETSDANLSYEIVTPPAHGGLTGSGQSRTYTPVGNYNGPDSFTYKVTDRGDPDNCGAPGPGCDGTKTSTTETVSITVNPVNDAPTATSGIRATDEDTPLTLDLASLVSDVETDAADLSYEIVTQPANGTATANTFTPAQDFNGTTSFTYKVTDRGDPDNCGAPGPACDAPMTSTTETVSITVGAINDAPLNTLPAGPLTATQNTDTPIIDASIADVDAGGDDVKLTLSVQHGTLTVSTSTPLGVLPADVTGNGTSTVTVLAPLDAINATLDAGDGLVYHGDAPYTGPDVLSFSTDDLGHNGAGGNRVDTDTLAISVVPPNAAPVAQAQSVSTDEDTAKTITLLASDDDGDDPLTFAKGTEPAHGSLGGIGPVTCNHATPTNTCTADVTYTPDADYFGPDSFTFTANDGIASSAPATVSITVDPVNDAPKLQDIEGGALAYTENDAATPITATTTVADDSPDLDTGTLTVDYTTGGTADDRLDIRNQGTGLGQIGVTGGTVTFGGVAIGTFAGGAGTTPLVVTLNSAATPSAAQALIRNVTYRNVSDSPTASRTARFVLTDGDGGTSNAATRAITVTVVNDPPVLANVEAGALDYTENDTPKAITSTLTVSDPDSTNLAGATVQITGNYQSGADVLAAAPQFGVTSNFDAGTGTLTLTGSTTVANYQTILRSVTYENTSETPSTAPRTVTFKVSDGAAESAAATRGIAVTAVDDAPTLTTSGGSTAYTEQDPAVVIDGGLVLADPDGGADPTAATVKIVSPAAGDSLVFSDQNGIIGSFASGTLTLSGAATQAQYQTALRSVRFANLTNDAPGASRSIEFQLTAPTASNTATKSIAITQVNDAPSTDPTDAAGSALEQTATAVDSGIVVSDPDSLNLKGATVQITGNFQSGQDTLQFANQNGITGSVSGSLLTLTGSATVAQYQTALRSVTYTNTSDTPSTLTRTITFRVSDDVTPSLQSAPQTRDLNVVPVNDAPTDAGESQNATGNTRLEVELTGGGSTLPKRTSATGNLLDNAADVDDAASALSIDATTVSDPPNGTVSVNADGSYVYTPDVGYTGADSFTYKVKDDENAQSATSTVSITVANRVWYVKNDFAGTADGRSETPFTTLATADTAANATADTIYVLRGTGTTGLTDTVDLLAQQRLLGEAVNLVVGGTTLFTGTQANRPPLTGTVNLDDGNTVSGVAIAGSGAPAIAGATGDVSGTIADVTLSGASGGLDLNATTGTWDLSDLSVNTSGGTAVNLTNAGTVNFTAAGTISLSSAAGPALVGTATTALSGTVDSVTTTSSPTTGISLTGTTGSLTLDDVNLTTTGTALTLNNANNVTVNNSGDADITATGTAINLTNGPTTQPGAPDVALDQVSSSGGTVGINIDGIGAGTFSAAGGALSGHSAAEIDINGGTGNITYPGTIGNGSGLSAQITGRSGGTVALSGNINDTNDAGGGVDMSGNTGGTFNFSGTTKTLNTTTGAAFSSTGSSPTINLTGGGLDIDTTSGSGLSATGGGTVNVTTGTNPNTIDSTTGTALDIENTTIGSSGATFRSITANGGNRGIVLIGTGSSGGLTVTGTGTAGSGGSITGITGADAATNGCADLGTTAPVGVGVYLKNTSSPSLSWMNFPGTFGNFGILGYSVAGFTLDHAAMTGTYGDNVNVDDDTVHFCTLTGTASITNSTISNGAESNLRLVNASGTLNRLTMSNNTFGLNGTGGGGGVLLEADNNGTVLNATVQDNTFQGSRGSPFMAVPQAGASMDLVFGQPGHGNTVHNTHSNIVPFAQDALFAAGGTFTFDINSNHFDSSSAVQAQGGVFINAANSTANATGHFRNNTIGNSGVANSGSSGNDPGLDVESNGGGDLTINVTNNQMYQWGSNGAGFLLQVGATSGSPTTVNATVTNNTIAEPGTFAVNNTAQGFQLNNGTNSGENHTTCLRFAGNVVDQAGTGAGGDVRLRQRFDTKVQMAGYTGAADGTSASPTVASFIQGLNTTGPPTVTSVSSTATGGGFFNTPSGAACAVPGF